MASHASLYIGKQERFISLVHEETSQINMLHGKANNHFGWIKTFYKRATSPSVP